MPHWSKLVRDPAHFAVLNNLDEPKTKKDLADETGLQVERCQKIIRNLISAEMVENEVQNGVRKIRKKDLEDRLDELRTSLLSDLVGGNREAVENGDYIEARRNLTQDLPVKGETRSTVAKLEAAEKLSSVA